MIVRTNAIPLAYYPYSSTSRIVHWLTRYQGKVSTLLKGALRPKSPFLGEYDLFSTSELLYYEKRIYTLHTGKECSMLHRRDAFRMDWRAMLTASYLTALFDKTIPDEAPQPEIFELYEELLDLAEEHGRQPQFRIWAELRFCDQQGHAPTLGHCTMCASEKNLYFCASQGGVVCKACSKVRKLPVLVSPPDVLAILCSWQQAEHPTSVVKTHLSGEQSAHLNAIMGAFIMYHFNLPLEYLNAVSSAST